MTLKTANFQARLQIPQHQTVIHSDTTRRHVARCGECGSIPWTKHNRRTTRLPGYDYTLPGAYFVTLCAWNRECLFGEVVGGEVELSPIGRIVQQEWLKSKEIRQEIRLFEDEFVVMPNHLHGIVVIIDEKSIPVHKSVGAHE